jgi:predicted permease
MLSQELTISRFVVATIQALERYFKAVYQAIQTHIPFTTLKAVVLASPGFTKDAVRLSSSLFNLFLFSCLCPDNVALFSPFCSKTAEVCVCVCV